MTTISPRRALWWSLALTALAVAAGLGVMRQTVASDPDDDEDERQYQLAVSRRLYEENCLMCHTAEMVEHQRLSPKQWAAEVDKMIGWGAPLPPEHKERLVAYLSERYPAGQPKPGPARVEAAELFAAKNPPQIDAAAHDNGAEGHGAALFATHCASCHGADALGGDLGTNLVERPVLLRPADYGHVVGDGLRRMPGFANVLGASDQADILAWLRTRRQAAPPSHHARAVGDE